MFIELMNVQSVELCSHERLWNQRSKYSVVIDLTERVEIRLARRNPEVIRK